MLNYWTDGSCSPNPGPGGWSWVRDNDETGGGFSLHTTNNVMELTAVLEAFKDAGDQPAVIHTDSQYVRKGLTEWLPGWKRKGWVTSKNEPVKNKDLWQELEKLYVPGIHRLVWVKGHNGDIMNERVDKLAVAQTRLAQQRIVPF